MTGKDFGNTRDAVKWIEQGADVHFVDARDGWAGIHYAVRNETFLPPNISPTDLFCFLVQARWGRTKIVEALMKAGVDINLRTTGKESALHKACRSSRKDTIIWMMLNGANPDMLNGNGERAADLTGDENCKFICDHWEEFLAIWRGENKGVEIRAKKNKDAVSKTSCDVYYDLDWDAMGILFQKALFKPANLSLLSQSLHR